MSLTHQLVTGCQVINSVKLFFMHRDANPDLIFTRIMFRISAVFAVERCPSVCLSVCPSRSIIVSYRIVTRNILVHSQVFSETNRRYKILMESSLNEVLNTGEL